MPLRLPPLAPVTTALLPTDTLVSGVFMGVRACDRLLLSIGQEKRSLFVAHAGGEGNPREALSALNEWLPVWLAVVHAASVKSISSSVPCVFSWGDAPLSGGRFTLHHAPPLPYETAMLHVSGAVLNTHVAVRMLRDGGEPRTARVNIDKALSHVAAAEKALHMWTDTLGRACAPTCLQGGGLEALRHWVMAWRHLAFAMAAPSVTTAVPCANAAAVSAHAAADTAVGLSCGEWREACRTLGDECRLAAALVFADAQKGIDLPQLGETRAF